jgi:hypothetical protein
MWPKEDDSSTGCVWDAGFHLVTARSSFARVLKLITLIFKYFLGRGEPRITEAADTKSVDTGTHLYIYIYIYICIYVQVGGCVCVWAR